MVISRSGIGAGLFDQRVQGGDDIGQFGSLGGAGGTQGRKFGQKRAVDLGRIGQTTLSRGTQGGNFVGQMCDGAAQAVQLGPTLFVLTGQIGDAGVQRGFGFRLFVAHGAQAFGELRVGHAFFVQRLVQAGDVFGVDASDRSGLRGKTVHPTPDTFQRGCDPSFKFRDLLQPLFQPGRAESWWRCG